MVAVANIRGGGEFGERWHQDGHARRTSRTSSTTSSPCAKQLLVDAKYTDAKRLAIEGGSNGGLLMGAVLTQRPELYRAVVAQVGYFDMLRYETRAQRRVQRHRVRHGEGRRPSSRRSSRTRRTTT